MSENTELMKYVATTCPYCGVGCTVNLVVSNGKVVGALATFRDLAEVRQMAEELTGVKRYVEALRAQAHEFRNKLHVINGLIINQRYTELSAYVQHLALAGLILPTPSSRNPAQAVGSGKSIWILRDGVPVEVAVTVGPTDGRNTMVAGEALVEDDAAITDQMTVTD